MEEWVSEVLSFVDTFITFHLKLKSFLYIFWGKDQDFPFSRFGIWILVRFQSFLMFYISISSSTNHSQSLCFIAARSLDYWWILFAIQSCILRLQSDLSSPIALPLFFRGHVSEDQECLRRIDLSSFISAPSLRAATLHWVKTWSALEVFLLLFLSRLQPFVCCWLALRRKAQHSLGRMFLSFCPSPGFYCIPLYT